MSRVKVVVRIRPLLDGEAAHTCDALRIEPLDGEGQPQPGLLTVHKPTGDDDGTLAKKDFKVDAVFKAATEQHQLFDGCNIRSMVNACLKGYHATIFAYGQTGSGKTYTIEGYDYDDPVPARDSRGLTEQRRRPRAHLHPSKLHKLGLMPRAIECLFSLIASKTGQPPAGEGDVAAAGAGAGATPGTAAPGTSTKRAGRRFRVRVTYLQIYNEQVYDLLNPTHLSLKRGAKPPPGLRVRWTKHDDFFVENLFSHEVGSAAEAMAYMHAGIKRKIMAGHSMNAASSRSHCLFRLHIESFNAATPEDVVTSRLTVVDLAGSERVARTNATGRTLKESIGINQSLFVLRNVVTALTSTPTPTASGVVRKPHVPYRDSKLTSLLKQSLGGNSLTLMVACVAPSDLYLEENLSTLQYATLASRIANRPTVNEDPRSRLIRQLRQEVALLKEQLQQAHATVEQLRTRVQSGGVDAAGVAAVAAAATAAPPLPPSSSSTSPHGAVSAGYGGMESALSVKLRAQLDDAQQHCSDLEADNTGLSLENQRLREKVEILEYLLADKDTADDGLGAGSGAGAAAVAPPLPVVKAGLAPPMVHHRTRPSSERSDGSARSGGSWDGGAPQPVDMRLLSTTGRLLARLPSFGAGLPAAPAAVPPSDPEEAMAELTELLRARAGLRQQFRDEL